MEMPNNCQQCDDFDKETKALVSQFLNQQELVFVTILLVGAYHQRKDMLKKVKFSDVTTRGAIVLDINLASHIMQKMIIAMDVEKRDTLVANFKDSGIEMKLTHGPCPHKEKPNAHLQAAP